MAYNRWLAPDELEHHGVKGQNWGERNGPPYPLSRQKRFSPDGGKVSQKKYLQVTGSGGTTAKRKRHTTSEKTEYQRKQSAERQERKANPEGTAWEQMERDNPINKLKGAYRRFKKNQERIAEENRKFDEDNKLFDEATDRVNKIEDLTEGEQRELAAILAKQQHDPKRKGSTNAKELADEVNAFADRVEKEHLTNVKQHGTAEEVMKYRDTFTKEEWREIADRLEAEARVKRLLDNPVTTQNNNQGGQQNQNKQNQPSQNAQPAEENLNFANRKAKEIYEKGTARDIYDNRGMFTPEQLEKATRRLEAEEKIGKYADVQVKIKSNKQLNFEKARDYLKIAGDSAEAISKILKLLDSSGSGNNKGNGSSKVEQVAKVISGVANAGEGGGKKSKGKNKNKG